MGPHGGQLQAIAKAAHTLSGEWRFAVDPNAAGEAGGWAALGFDDADWALVEVPHTWNVMADHVDYEGLAWYRRSFATPALAQEALVRLRFEAVYYQARAWLNGAFLGAHEGGYTPFEFDGSAHLLPDGENVLAVQVDNEARTDRIPTPPMGWYNYGGILRDVSLEVTSRAYIRRQRIVAVPHLVGEDEADEATIAATTWVRNTSDESLQGTLLVVVIDDASGQAIPECEARSTLDVAPGQEASVEWTVTLASPKLWHFDHPNLYRWSTALLGADGEALHTDEVAFGIRSVQLEEGRFVLNGEPMRLVGFNRHADSPEHGPAEPVEVMAADYDDMKRLNMVLTRPVHYPQHPFILDYCDRKGILMIPEVPAWQLRPGQMADPQMRALERRQLREMIESEWNHPSIWAWSVANEIASNTPEGRAFVRDMAAYVHEIDPTRPVSFASDHLGQGAWRDACADLVLMNEYYGMWHGPKDALGPVLDVVHASWPEKVVFISEWGFAGAWRGWESPPRDPSRYYDVPEGVPPDAPEADDVRCQVIVDQMPVMRSKPFVAGAVFWCYQDYRTPGGDYVMGVVDVHRERRGSWQLLREEYAPILFESVTLIASGDRRGATVALRTRGPLECDMPAYVLRGYHLQWAVMRQGEGTPFAEGALALPVLAPGSDWSGEIAWSGPEGEHVLHLSVVRPTGFVVIERTLSVRRQADA